MKSNREDDLTVIAGIGAARQKWFREQFHVDSYAALGDLSVEEVETAAKKSGKILAPAQISDWIEQARTLVVPNEVKEAAVETAVANPPPLWKPIASFVVEYQERTEAGQPQRRTKAHYMEADEEITWPGIEREQIGLWIEQHVKVPEPQVAIPRPTAAKKPAAPTVLAKRAAPPVAAIKPVQVRVRQQPDYLSVVDIAEAERPFLGHVHHENPVLLEIDFALDPVAAESPQTVFAAHCHVRNLSAGEKAHYLEMRGKVAPHCHTYTCDLSELEPGIYGLGVLVREERPFGTAYFALPKLNVL